MSDPTAWKEGEPVLLVGSEGNYLLRLRRGPQEVERAGVLDLSDHIGTLPGGTVSWAGRNYTLVRPGLPDLLGHLRRTTQVVTAKDAMQLLYLAGVGSGATVIEAGCGTGSLTTVLAFAIGPSGHLHAFDRREDFLEGARSNLARFGLGDRVEFHLRDVANSGFDVGPVDSVLLDLPEPWQVFEAARTSLVPGGRVAVFTPTYNQLERSVRALRDAGFVEVQSSELLQRALHIGEGGTRPDFEMLGHTGFLTGARRRD